jgi:probable phosphoglycerate mutase
MSDPLLGDEPAPARVVLIRHGESHSNRHGWISGQDSCKGLTELGRTQAVALRERLHVDEDLRPDTILVSTMRRAVETAEIIAEPHGMAVEQHADLIERTSGEAEGLTVEEYRQTYGSRPWTDWENPLSPGGESGPEFLGRVSSAVGRVAANGRGRTTWVVCHGGVIMATATRRWPGAPGRLFPLPVTNPANTSISEWWVVESGEGDPVWQLARYNDATHLVGIDHTAPISI